MQNLPLYFDNPQFRADALRVISETIEKIDEKCARLGSLRKKIEVRPEKVDLNELLARTIQEMRASLDGTVETDLNPVPPVLADRDQTRQVLANLLLNAREAAGKTGRIRVRTAARNGRVEIAVRDDGSGMTPDFITNSLFRPFQSTKKRGMGIGLFQCRMIVEAHRGRIEVESEPGKGSTFRVLLPAVPGEP
jgi:signal transduction histidine kinase